MKKTGQFFVFANRNIGTETVLLQNGDALLGLFSTKKEVDRINRKYPEDPVRGGTLMRLRLVRPHVWREVGRRLKRGACLHLLPDQVEKLREDSKFLRKTRKGDVVQTGKFSYVLWKDKRGRWYAA